MHVSQKCACECGWVCACVSVRVCECACVCFHVRDCDCAFMHPKITSAYGDEHSTLLLSLRLIPNEKIHFSSSDHICFSTFSSLLPVLKNLSAADTCQRYKSFWLSSALNQNYCGPKVEKGPDKEGQNKQSIYTKRFFQNCGEKQFSPLS